MRVMIMLVAAFLVTSCSTPYQKKGFRGGYEDLELSKGVYLITVEGNGYTGLATLYNIAARRAKELCPNGFNTVNNDSSSNTNLTSNINGTGYQTVTRHSMAVQVKCIQEEKSK